MPRVPVVSLLCEVDTTMGILRAITVQSGSVGCLFCFQDYAESTVVISVIGRVPVAMG